MPVLRPGIYLAQNNANILILISVNQDDLLVVYAG